MRPFKWMFFSLILAFSVSSCFIDLNDDGSESGCLRGQGAIISVDLDLNRIDAIDLKLPATVYLRQGAVQQVTVEGQANIIDYLERTVRGGLWEVEAGRCIRDMEDLRIFITVPEVEAIKISGSGKIIGENLMGADDLEVLISGSGDISLELAADDVNSEISGSGSLLLEGEADQILFEVTGSGNLNAYGLKARKGDVRISGSGDAEVYVTEELNVEITGSGDVLYHGSPSLNVAISGSGEVVDAN